MTIVSNPQTPADAPQCQKAKAHKDSTSARCYKRYVKSTEKRDVTCLFGPPDPRPLLLRYKNKTHDSTMAILDIGLLTGFTYDTDDLNKVKLIMDQRSSPTCKKSQV